MDEKAVDNVKKYISLQPLVGMMVSVLLLILFIIRGTKWSVEAFLYVMMPLVLLSTVFFVCFFLLHRTLSIQALFLHKPWVFPFLIMLVILIVLNGLFYFQSEKSRIGNVEFEELEELLQQESDSQTSYYLIFISENCYICSQMDEMYEGAVREAKAMNVYYCDLSMISIEDDFVSDLAINSIPVLIEFKEGKEVRRLEGRKQKHEVLEFLNNQSGGDKK